MSFIQRHGIDPRQEDEQWRQRAMETATSLSARGVCEQQRRRDNCAVHGDVTAWPRCMTDIDAAMLSMDLREVRRGGLPPGVEELHGTTLPGKTLVQVMCPAQRGCAARSGL